MTTSSFPAVLAGEWIKTRTLRSSWITLALTVLLGIGLSALIGLSMRDYVIEQSPERFDPFFVGSYGVLMAQLALVVYGVFAFGSEFSSRTIGTSLVAVPRRGRFFLGKVLVCGAVALAVSLVTVVSAFFAGQAGLGPIGIDVTDAGIPEALAGSAVYLTLLCLFAMGLTALLRSSVATLAILMPVFFLGSQGLGNIPAIKDYAQYLPDQAGLVMLRIAPQDGSRFSHDFGPWTGIGIVALWAVAALVAGWWMTRRRDV